MAFSLMLGVVSFAGDESGELEISQARLEFADCVYLLIAVDYTAVGSADGITLNITNNGVTSTLTPDPKIAAPNGCVAFRYIDLGAKNMGDELTLQALKDGEPNGESKTYSILEYALKATSGGDEKLINLVNAMIRYGAKAQAAWNYEGDYDLTKEYGLVVVGGATKETKKTIAEVGTTVTPEMDAAKFPAGAELYGINFEKADSVVVTKGMSRYYYFGTDIYGDKYGDGATTYNDHVATNLDLDTYTGGKVTYLYDKDNYSYKDANGKDLQAKYWGKNLFIHSQTGAVSFQHGGMAGFAANKTSVWTLYSDKIPKYTGNNYYANDNSDLSYTNYKGGKIVLDNGYLLIDCYSEYINEETGERYETVGYNLRETHNYLNPYPTIMHDPDNFLKDGKFTIGFSVAKKADVPFVTGSKCYIGTSNTDYTPLFTADGATLKYGDTVIVNLKEFTGDAPTQSDYTTFYMVFDVNTNTVTVHRDDGISITLPVTFSNAKVTDLKTWLNGEASKQGFYWDIPGSSGEA